MSYTDLLDVSCQCYFKGRAQTTGLAKHYGVSTLCSSATRSKLPAAFFCRKLDLVKVKGKEEAVWIYDPQTATGHWVTVFCYSLHNTSLHATLNGTEDGQLDD